MADITDLPQADSIRHWMQIALDEARTALNDGEAPIGAGDTDGDLFSFTRRW